VALRRSQLTGRALSRTSTYGFQIKGPDIVTSLNAFNAMLSDEVLVAQRNLGQAAVNRLEKNFNQADTEWGQARIAGEKNGVKFNAYGRTTGRNDTGKMIESLGWEVIQDLSGSGVQTKARFGWIFEFEEYFRMQEEGFTGYTAFAGVDSSGNPTFGPSRRSYKVEGANAFPDALKLVDQLKESFYKQAYNRALARWRQSGRRTSPGSYESAKRRYERSR